MDEELRFDEYTIEWYSPKIEDNVTYYFRVYVVNPKGDKQSEIGTQVASATTKA